MTVTVLPASQTREADSVTQDDLRGTEMRSVAITKQLSMRTERS